MWRTADSFASLLVSVKNMMMQHHFGDTFTLKTGSNRLKTYMRRKLKQKLSVGFFKDLQLQHIPARKGDLSKPPEA